MCELLYTLQFEGNNYRKNKNLEHHEHLINAKVCSHLHFCLCNACVVVLYTTLYATLFYDNHFSNCNVCKVTPVYNIYTALNKNFIKYLFPTIFKINEPYQ